MLYISRHLHPAVSGVLFGRPRRHRRHLPLSHTHVSRNLFFFILFLALNKKLLVHYLLLLVALKAGLMLIGKYIIEI